jgi:glycosyltransferase involved in cell wall biosynthesis
MAGPQPDSNGHAGRETGVTLSVVVPALNEEDGIAGILQQILATRPALSRIGVSELQVIVVDDGSADETARIVEATPGVELVRHTANRGYGAAIKTGFRKATGELLAFLDADSTYPPEYLVKLAEVAILKNADLVVGSRRSGSESHMPAVRRLGNLIWSMLLSFLGNSQVEDPASGMRVLRRDSLPRLYPLPDGLHFTPVMSTRAIHEGITFIEVPIAYRERSGRSKLSVVGDGIRFLKMILWTALQYNPARLLELIGFAASAAAAALGMLLVTQRLQGVTELGPWGVFGVYASLILAVCGVSLFSLGISFNYLVALFHRRPIRQPNLIAAAFSISPERHFGWISVLLIAGGAAVGACSLALGIRGWEITRLWLWFLGSALFLLAGVQLLLFWILIRVMQTLNEREELAGVDLVGSRAAAPVPALARTAAIGGLRLD